MTESSWLWFLALPFMCIGVVVVIVCLWATWEYRRNVRNTVPVSKGADRD